MEKMKELNKVKVIDDPCINAFLDVQTTKTRATYTDIFKRVLDFTGGESGEQMIKDHVQWEKRIFSFMRWLLDKKYSRNTVQTHLAVVRGFFSFNKVPLVFNNQEKRKLNLKSRNSEDYIFSQQDLKAMSHGTPTQLYILTCGLSFGLRAEDFTSLTFGDYRSIIEKAERENLKAPLFIKELWTSKEKGVKARLFLSEDALKIVKVLLETHKDAKDTDKVYTSNPENLTIELQKLFKRSGLEAHGKRVRFQTLRKILFSALSREGSEEYAKMIIGKAVNAGDQPYLNENELMDVFAKAMPRFSVFNGNGTELKNTVAEMEKQLKAKDAKIAELETKLEATDADNKSKIDQLFKMFDDLKSSTGLNTQEIMQIRKQRQEAQEKQ